MRNPKTARSASSRGPRGIVAVIAGLALATALVVVVAPVANAARASAVAAGYGHTCALTGGRGVKCWGNNDGQLGDGTTTDRADARRRRRPHVGRRADGRHGRGTLRGHPPAASSAGARTTGARSATVRRTARLTPVDVVGLTCGLPQVTAGTTTRAPSPLPGRPSAGATTSGASWVTAPARRLTPVDVVGLGSGVRSMDAGGIHTSAVTVAGAAKCWGYNDSGELGDGTRQGRRKPADVVGLTSGVAAISAGL